jgi:bifunctional UDP-N-acetylglucosamine pyrophosphorylase/glucosamine-1-phosphate N-acetyltransferase
MDLAIVILAAGMGTRMRSKLPQAFHSILGKPLLNYLLDATRSLEPAQTVVVVGHQAEQVKEQLEDHESEQAVSFILQSPQLGTGHALQQTTSLLSGKSGLVLVLPSNLPLLGTQTLEKLLEAQQSSPAPVTVLTTPIRVGVDEKEQDDQYRFTLFTAQPNTPEYTGLSQANTGVYLFRADWLWNNIAEISADSNDEYCLSRLIDKVLEQGQPVQLVTLKNAAEVIAVNNRARLAQAEAIKRQQINQKWMEAGVTLVDPNTTYIGLDVVLGQDTVIYPNTYLYGKTTVGNDAVLGPGTFIINSSLGHRCEIRFAVVEDSILEDDVDVGPYAHLRNKAHLAAGVHMGNFGEVKNSYLGPGTKMGHFSYLGDAQVGENVNIGAGTITCNYDGKRKHPTQIGDNAFIGSDTMLVAPVNIGKNAKTGAGSVVTRDVPDDTVAYGVPARLKS